MLARPLLLQYQECEQTMNREYHKWWSWRLGRDMELLIFGHSGVPAVVFPTSQGRFYEFDDRGMVGAIAHKIENGELQLYCLDSLDAESWYNRNVPPRWRIARHVQYEDYVMKEVLPLVRLKNHDSHLISLGCSFGGYHAVNIALRHPDRFTGFLSMSGAFDQTRFLHGYYDNDVYFSTPPHYIPNMGDPWYLDRYRHNTYVLATGWDDQCLGDNQYLSRQMGEKGIPHNLYIWDSWNSHDWPTWAHMMNIYL
jgi:esterase/lipase superfamily enzyme